jgi:hypothetical protein
MPYLLVTAPCTKFWLLSGGLTRNCNQLQMVLTMMLRGVITGGRKSGRAARHKNDFVDGVDACLPPEPSSLGCLVRRNRPHARNSVRNRGRIGHHRLSNHAWCPSEPIVADPEIIFSATLRIAVAQRVISGWAVTRQEPESPPLMARRVPWR